MPFGQHRNKPLREIDVSYLDWALKCAEGVEKRPALKADIEAWLQRKADKEERDPRQAEWDRNAQRLAEAGERQRAPMPEALKQQWRAPAPADVRARRTA